MKNCYQLCFNLNLRRYNAVTMVVFNQTNSDSTRYAYAAPVVESVQPSQAAPGAVVTVTGRNFGVTVTDVAVKLGAFDCLDLAQLAEHTTLTCTVPAAEGKALPAVATVNSLAGSPAGAAQFTFTKTGCISETATNYDVNATMDLGLCNIEGCTNPGAYNYNPEANAESGTCEDPPVVVSMRIKAGRRRLTPA
jgi:hypothetical protein